MTSKNYAQDSKAWQPLVLILIVAAVIGAFLLAGVTTTQGDAACDAQSASEECVKYVKGLGLACVVGILGIVGLGAMLLGIARNSQPETYQQPYATLVNGEQIIVQGDVESLMAAGVPGVTSWTKTGHKRWRLSLRTSHNQRSWYQEAEAVVNLINGWDGSRQ